MQVLRKTEPKQVIDEAVISVFKSPESYTGEDVIELSLHGSPVIVSEVLGVLYDQGARPAQPGEFTFRAFLNNKIDLTQAEAVADVITARTGAESRRAMQQLRGGIGEQADSISDNIVRLLSTYELEMDFVEDDVELMGEDEKLKIVHIIKDDLTAMLSGYQLSRRMRDGALVVIAGAPNVGKSTLFNRLTSSEKAITHEVPGTTRDILEASGQINGIPVTYFDTAGLRLTEDVIEEEGVNRANRAIESADIIIMVTSPDVKTDYALNLSELPVITVQNKYDAFPRLKSKDFIKLSALSGLGLDELKDRIFSILSANETANQHTISRERHYKSVRTAAEAIERTIDVMHGGYPSEIIAEELREALEAMDELTGKRRLKGLLEEIFGSFCIGK